MLGYSVLGYSVLGYSVLGWVVQPIQSHAFAQSLDRGEQLRNPQATVAYVNSEVTCCHPVLTSYPAGVLILRAAHYAALAFPASRGSFLPTRIAYWLQVGSARQASWQFDVSKCSDLVR